MSSCKNGIVITGDSGFIGSHLRSYLERKGFRCKGFSVEDGDISEAKFIDKNCMHVFHLAANTFVPDSLIDPYTFYRTNLLGTINVLQQCKNCGVSLTYLSSYVYGTPEYLPIDENHSISPHSPYNHSKILAEQSCSYFADAFDMKINIIRPFNIYGPKQNKKFLIPHIVSQVSGSSNSVMVESSIPKRDFLYIDDFIELLGVSMKSEQNTIVNAGSGSSYSVREIFNILCKISGKDKILMEKDLIRPNEIEDIVADISFAKDKFNWAPKTDIRTGLEKCYFNEKMKI